MEIYLCSFFKYFDIPLIFIFLDKKDIEYVKKLSGRLYTINFSTKCVSVRTTIFTSHFRNVFIIHPRKKIDRSK